MKVSRIWVAVVAALVLCHVGTSAFAAEAWVRSAKKLFEGDEYEKCIELSEPHKKTNIGAMFLAFSHLQESVFNRTKYDKEKFKAYKTQLQAKTSIKDLDDLLYFVNLSDKPEVVKQARGLAKHTFKGISDIDDVPKLVTFLSTNDEQAQKLALSSIKRIIEPKRKYVQKGGTLRPKDVNVMNSSNLINPLLQRVDKGDAVKTLILIEEPVLQYLGKYSGVEITKLETNINKAIAKRTKKYPDSNWHSAVGKK